MLFCYIIKTSQLSCYNICRLLRTTMEITFLPAFVLSLAYIYSTLSRLNLCMCVFAE